MQTVYHVAIRFIGYHSFLFFVTKRCTTCEKDKFFDEFPTSGSRDNGYKNRCLQCKRELYASATPEEVEERKATRKASEDLRREEIRATDRQRGKTEHRKEANNKWGREQRAKQRVIREAEKAKQPPVPLTLFKVCPRCSKKVGKPVEKFLSEFNLDNKNKSDGRQAICRECEQAYASSEEQKAKRREYIASLGSEHRQEKYIKHKQWRKDNAEKIREQSRIKYATDPAYAERIRRNTLAWIETHPMALREAQMRRKFRIKETIVEIVNYEEILAREGLWCYICEKEILPHHTIEFDHRIPLLPRPGELQGTHTADNIFPSHKECNARKRNRRFEDLTPFDRRGVEY